MSRYFLGLDVGTQSVRAALFDERGQCLGSGVSPLETTHPHPGWAEQDANQWWSASRNSVATALARARIGAEQVAAIGLDCTACTVIPSAKDGTPLRRALLWMDQRAHREANEISSIKDPTLRYVSNVVSPEWMLPKALWLKRHEPSTYESTQRMVECTDWFNFKLTGEWTLSLNNVTVKWNYVRPEGGWSKALLSQLQLDDLPSKWPSHVVPLGKGEAYLSATAAQDLGLKQGTPVAQGGIDAYLGTLGLGAVGAGDLAMIVGSSTCHLACSSTAVLGSGMLGCFPDAMREGIYTLEGGQTSTGSILEWFRRNFADSEQRIAEQVGKPVWQILDERASAVAPGCDGVTCLDFWQGNRCPIKDPLARGVWWGLSLSHTAAHLYRSIYEATACGTRHILEDLDQHGLKIERIFAGGGGTRSDLWMQIHADVLGIPIQLSQEDEACALGSALIAAVRLGQFANFEEAVSAMVRPSRTIEPNLKNRAIYDEVYERYRATYPALKQLFHTSSSDISGSSKP